MLQNKRDTTSNYDYTHMPTYRHTYTKKYVHIHSTTHIYTEKHTDQNTSNNKELIISKFLRI